MLNLSAFFFQRDDNAKFCGFPFFFVDFQNFTKIEECWRQLFVILSIHKPSLGHVRFHTKSGPNRFSRFDVYWIQTDRQAQGCNARKVISELYTFFLLQCTVFGQKSKHKRDVTAWHGIHFYKNNLWNILVIGNYYVNYQNYQS